MDHPILTSCGIFEYANPDGSIRRELRLPEEVFNDKSLESYEGKRYDSVEDASVFFARELDFVKSHAYDKQYPEFTALGLFPVSNEVDPGAESITYYAYDKTGIAKIISNYATDLPRADVKGEPHTAQVKSVGASYGYSVQEMRASRMAGKNLDARKADAARYAIDYTLNRIAWAGDDETGLQGVLSSGNDVPLYVIPAGASGKTDWNSKTAEEIMVDINGMQKYTARITKNVERPDTLYYERISSEESYIVFLRQTDKPNRPWYTLEIEPGGTIRQKRSYSNEQYSDLQEAVPFLKEWQQVVQKRMDEKERKLAVESKEKRNKEFEELTVNGNIIHTGRYAGKLLVDELMKDLMEAAATA